MGVGSEFNRSNRKIVELARDEWLAVAHLPTGGLAPCLFEGFRVSDECLQFGLAKENGFAAPIER
jgi:hypothetical protein